MGQILLLCCLLWFSLDFRLLDENVKPMKTGMGKRKLVLSKSARPKMTRKLAEARAIGNPKGPKFDGAAFLASLKK